MSKKRRSQAIAAALLLALLGACATTGQSALPTEQTRIWRFYRQGSADTNTLFGTIHVQDERAFGDEKLLRELVPRHEVLAVEIHPDSLGSPSLGNLISMTDTTLYDLLSSADEALLDSTLRVAVGNGVESYARIQPIFVATLLTTGNMKADRELPLDLFVAQLGADAGLEVAGLETPTEQIDAITAISLPEQADILIEVLHDMDGQLELSESLIDAFARHDLPALDSLLQMSMGDTPSGKEINRRVFGERNKVMLERILGLLERGRVFVAVGSGHLAGRGGLIDLLRRSGYRVEAVKPDL